MTTHYTLKLVSTSTMIVKMKNKYFSSKLTCERLCALTGNNLLYTQLDVTYEDSYHGVFLISVTPLQFLFQIVNFNCHIRWRLTYICVHLRKNAPYSYVYLTSIIVIPHTLWFSRLWNKRGALHTFPNLWDNGLLNIYTIPRPLIVNN